MPIAASSPALVLALMTLMVSLLGFGSLELVVLLVLLLLLELVLGGGDALPSLAASPHPAIERPARRTKQWARITRNYKPGTP